MDRYNRVFLGFFRFREKFFFWIFEEKGIGEGFVKNRFRINS